MYSLNLWYDADSWPKHMKSYVCSVDIYVYNVSLYLWYDGDSWSEHMKSYVCDVNVVNDYLSLCCLNDTEQGQSERGLAGTCPSHNANLNENKYYVSI